jgi:hypothetical protein
MDSLTLSLQFLSMMKTDDLCFTPCQPVAAKGPASLSEVSFERRSLLGTPYREQQEPALWYDEPSETSVSSWPYAGTPHPCSFNANIRYSLRPDDASFCQYETNLSCPRLQHSDSDNDESRGEVTDTSTKYEDSSSNDAGESQTDSEYDDESSFSELSYDGIEFDFGYASYKAAKCVRTARTNSVVVEVPDHILKEMANRQSDKTDQEDGRASELRQLLRPRRSQTSPTVIQVLPWPEEKVKTLQGSYHTLSDTRTTAPTMPRRRESLSTASSLDEDESEPLAVPLQEPTVFYLTSPPPRIPLELQRVFLESQAGLHAEASPSTNLTAFQEC